MSNSIQTLHLTAVRADFIVLNATVGQILDEEHRLLEEWVDSELAFMARRPERAQIIGNILESGEQLFASISILFQDKLLTVDRITVDMLDQIDPAYHLLGLVHEMVRRTAEIIQAQADYRPLMRGDNLGNELIGEISKYLGSK